MKTRRLWTTILLLLGHTAFAAESDQALLHQAQQLFKPLPKDFGTQEFPITPERAELGRKLFFDPRPSLDGTVSCARCHLPWLYATDGLPKAVGVQNRANPRNAPTLLNAAGQIAAHWRGDRKNVEDQARGALTGPGSYGQPDAGAAMAALRALPEYPALFRKAFPGEADPITPDNFGKAVGAYERTLVSRAPFDSYLEGQVDALPPKARAGLERFIATGCAGCHNGAGVGGGMYARFGVVSDYWKATGSHEIDNGRFDLTKNEADRYQFKVPILRNVARTPPYFHDGSVATLPEAVRVMAKVQLGKELSDAEVDDLVAFLDSLTGELPKNYAEAPLLPAGSFVPAAAH